VIEVPHRQALGNIARDRGGGPEGAVAVAQQDEHLALNRQCAHQIRDPVAIEVRRRKAGMDRPREDGATAINARIVRSFGEGAVAIPQIDGGSSLPADGQIDFAVAVKVRGDHGAGFRDMQNVAHLVTATGLAQKNPHFIAGLRHCQILQMIS
jgi:hypothetical protein